MQGVWGSKSSLIRNAHWIAVDAAHCRIAAHRRHLGAQTWQVTRRLVRTSLPTAGCVLTFPYLYPSPKWVKCQEPVEEPAQTDLSSSLATSSSSSIILSKPKSFLQKVQKSIRILFRIVQLIATLAPLAILYPIRYSLLSSTTEDDPNQV